MEIPSQEVDAQTWDMHGVDLRWSHLHFVWTKGKHYAVRGVSRARPVPQPARPLRVVQGSTTIMVETGRLKAVISKHSFALFDELRFDPSGRGRYSTRILGGSRGPEIVDRGTTFATRFDSDAKVTVEVSGPVYAVIKAEGVYQDAGRTGSDWASFTTRLHFWAGQEWIRVVHNLGYREDMAGHEYDRAVLLMPFDFAERFAFAADGNGAAHKGDFAGFAGADLYLHQDKHDAYRFGSDTALSAGAPQATGGRSENCWAIQGGARQVRVECYLRNGWQEFPFEAKVGPQEMGVSMQPWHGYETFGPLDGSAHVGEQEIHKLRYAHSGAKQRQGLPCEYVNAFNAIDSARTARGEGAELGETSATAAASANWQGVMLRQDFYLRVLQDRAASLASFDVSHLPAVATLVQRRPIAIPDASHVQESFVFGPIGTRRDGYDEVFTHVADIIKGDYNPERGEYYGRFRWGAMPHRWFIDVNRPHWHRLEYGDCHYDRIALIFWYYTAAEDPELLQVARKAVKFHQCFRYINFEPRSPIDNHAVMLQWHKGLTPGADVSGDYAAGRTGHSLHAYSMLVGWLVDADLDLLDAYTRWSNNARHLASDRDRNTNNNLHEAIQQYEFFHDRRMKNATQAIAAVLTSEPMSAPAGAARAWDAAWPLYLDLFGGRGVRGFFANEATPGHWLHDNTSLANMSLCYRVTGDRTFLQRALKPLRSLVLRNIFRTSSGPYSPAFFQNVYGQPETHKTLLHYLYYLKEAVIADVPDDDGEPGQYPIGLGTHVRDDVIRRGIWIPILNTAGQQFRLRIRRLGSDRAAAFLYAPDRTELLGQTFLNSDSTEQTRESGWGEFFREVVIPARPAGGRYDLFLSSIFAGQFLPTTAEGFPECAVIRNAFLRDDNTGQTVRDREYHAYVMRMYLLPTTSTDRIDWTFSVFRGRYWERDQNGCPIRIFDAAGRAIIDSYLMRSQPLHHSFTASMNGPGDPPTPWMIDCGGVGFSIEATSMDAFNAGTENLALLGADLTVLTMMGARIPLRGWDQVP